MPTVEQIPASKIGVDQSYQRPLNRAHVMKIAREFDPDKVGAVVVSYRDDGSYWVIDGQHRVAAMHSIGFDDPIQCLVYEGLTLDREAKMFSAQADSRRMHPVHLYLAKITGGDPKYIAIDEVVQESGFEVSVNKKGNTIIQAPGALVRAFDRGGADHLRVTLAVLSEAWAGRDKMPPAYMITGISAIILRYGLNNIDTGHLGDALRRTATRELATIASGLNLDMQQHHRLDIIYGRAIREVYNQKLKAGQDQLPPWDGEAQPVAEDQANDTERPV